MGDNINMGPKETERESVHWSLVSTVTEFQVLQIHCHNTSVLGDVRIKKLHGLSPQANYTDRATAASRRSVANLCG
jgi:hypothetical protein